MMNAIKLSLPSKLYLEYIPGFVDTILHANALVLWCRRNLGSDGITSWCEDANIGERSLLSMRNYSSTIASKLTPTSTPNL